MDTLNFLSSDFNAVLITLKLALTTCFFLALIGTPLAYFLAFKSKRAKPFLESIVTLPLVLPPTVIGFYLIVFFSPDTALGKFFILHIPYDCEPINNDLIDRLLSPSTLITLLKSFIFF